MKAHKLGLGQWVVAGLLLGLAAIPQMAAADGQEPVLKPVFACDEPVYDFGSAVATGSVSHSYAFRNDGKLSLVISDVRASCGCTVAKVREDTIPPGGAGAIDVTFNLVGRQGFQTKTITVTCNDPDRPSVLLTLRGTVVKPVWATPAALYLGRIATPEQRHVMFSLDAERPVMVRSWRATGPSQPEVEYLGASADSDGRHHDFRVTIVPPSAEGPFNGEIRVETDDERQPLVVVPYTGYWAIPVASP